MLPQAPEVESPQETDQFVVTAVPPSVALKPCCAPAATVAEVGEITSVLALEMVTVALAVFVVSAWATAVTVTVELGTELGAV
jgi:hypothetical protein